MNTTSVKDFFFLTINWVGSAIYLVWKDSLGSICKWPSQYAQNLWMKCTWMRWRGAYCQNQTNVIGEALPSPMVGRERKATWRKRSEVMKAVVGRIASNVISWLKFSETLLGIMSHRALHSKEVFLHETLSKEQSCSDKLLDGFHYLVLYKDILLSWPISCKWKHMPVSIILLSLCSVIMCYLFIIMLLHFSFKKSIL